MMQLRHLDFADLQASSLTFPAENELHIWTFKRALLGKMHKTPDSHTVLTHILSRMLNVPESAILLGLGDHGKPFLISPGSTPAIHFNLSHSGEYIVLAFSSCPVGIDIECVDRNAKIDQIATRFFHPVERNALSILEGRNKKKHFFRIWTIKEAFLKGLGTGLTRPMNSFYTIPDGKHTYQIIAADKKDQEEYSSWTLQAVPAPAHYICTVCYRDS